MPIAYRKDIIAALREQGYNTNRLRKEKLLSEGVIQALREGRTISLQNIGKICDLLKCQPNDILVVVDDEGRDSDGFLVLNHRQGVGENDDGK